MTTTTFYFVIGSKQFLLIDEPLEEILRERVEHYKLNNLKIDFWLLPNPEFFNTSEFAEMKAKCPKDLIAIVSTNKTFIDWINLRLNNVASGSFSGPSSTIPNPLAYN